MKKDGIQTRNRKLSTKSKKNKGKLAMESMKQMEDNYSKFPMFAEQHQNLSHPHPHYHTGMSDYSMTGPTSASIHHSHHHSHPHSMTYSPSSLCNSLYPTGPTHVPVPCSLPMSSSTSSMVGAMAWFDGTETGHSVAWWKVRTYYKHEIKRGGELSCNPCVKNNYPDFIKVFNDGAMLWQQRLKRESVAVTSNADDVH